MRVFDGYPKYLMLKTDAPESALFRHLLSVYPGKLIEITSRSDDGRAIHGYFTPASGFERGKAPMLVLVTAAR